MAYIPWRFHQVVGASGTPWVMGALVRAGKGGHKGRPDKREDSSAELYRRLIYPSRS